MQILRQFQLSHTLGLLHLQFPFFVLPSPAFGLFVRVVLVFGFARILAYTDIRHDRC